MITVKRLWVILLCAAALCASVARAELLAYEGFVYDETNRINGLNGGSGWRMPWNESAARFRVVAPTLQTAGLAAYGNTIEGLNAAADQTAWRRFYGKDGADYIGGAYSTNWFSFMLQHRGEAQVYGGSTGCVVILAATDASYGANRLWYIGAQLQFTNSLGQYVWGFRGQGALIVRASEHAVVSGETVHIVLRMAQGAGSTELAMWINPAVTNEPALSGALVGVTNMTMQSSVVIPSYGYARCAYDEIRVGDTWADMTNMPLTADKPVNQLPVNGAGQVSQPVTLQGSAFSSALPGDTLAASQFALTSLDGAVTSVTASATSVSVGGLLQNTRYNWQVRYKGTASGAWGPWSDATWFDTAGSVPDLLAYDGAAYAATGSVAGAAGGHGWLGGWVAETATATNLLSPAGVSSPGLYYGNLAGTGNTFMTENPLALRSVGARRQLARDGVASLLNTNGLFGRPGATNWFSVIVTSPDSSVGGYGLSARPKMSDSLDRLFFGKSRFGRAWLVSTWAGNGNKSFDAGEDAQPVFLVCRVVHGMSSNDTAALGWVNPDPATEPEPATAAIAVTNTIAYDYGVLRIGADTANAGEIAPLAYLDEVRLGTSFEAVAPTRAIPNQPVNQTPTTGEVTGVTVTLQGSAFSSGVPGDTHTASDFELWLGTQSVFSTNVPGAVTALLLPAGLLQSDVRYTWRLRYYGNAMPSAWSVATYFEVQNTNAPRLVVYDGAVYAATNSIGGLQGGSGWQGAWTALVAEGTSVVSKIAAEADGLSYDTLIVNGGRFVADTTLRTADAARGLDGLHCAHLTDAAGAWGRPGTTNWLAYLARNDSGFGGYRLHLNTSSAAPYYYQSVCSFGPAFSSPQWTLSVAGQTVTVATPDPLTNVTHWLVARLVFGLTPDSSTAHVWVDPPPGSEPEPAAASLALTTVSNFTYTLLGLYAAPAAGSSAAPAVSLDEVKISETWDTLAEVPEPAGLLLLLPLLARRARPRVGMNPRRGLLLLLLGALAVHGAALTNVRCRVVDCGNNMSCYGTAYYRGSSSTTKITLGTEYLRYRYFSPTVPLNPPWPFYDIDAPSARFYGGMLGIFTQSAGDLTEGMINANHELRDDFNLMANASGIAYNGRCYGLWYWEKADFLNGGAGGRVAFDEHSMIVPHISRFFAGMGDMSKHEGGGCWVARDGAQWYMSQRTFYDHQTNIGRAAATHTSYILHPTETLWAPYNPSGDYAIVFDRTGAVWAAHSFTDVTAVGFYSFKDVFTTEGVQIKWHSFEVYANVERTNIYSPHLELRPVPAGTLDGTNVPAFLIGATEIPYTLWKKIHKWAASQQFCVDISLGYIFDRDGNMGSMSLSTDAVHRAGEPATVMSWYDAVAWCNALSEHEGLTPCYYSDAATTNVLRWIKDRTYERYNTNKFHVYVNWGANGYRLPTMIEWARACGSATNSPDQAWTQANASNRTHAVGLLATNEYGVADLFGNVWEYTWDVANAGDHFAPQAVDQHTVLGGSFTYPAAPTHTPLPYGELPYKGAVDIGFRVVRGGGAPPATQTCGSVPQRTVVEGQQLPPAAAALPPSISNLLVALRGTNSYSYWYTNETGVLAFNRSDGARVTVSPFAMTRVEIPYAVWNAVYQWAVNTGYVFETDGDMGSMDYRTEEFEHAHTEPVTDVNWNDALVWCNAASELDGLQPCYYADSNRTVVIKNANQWRLGMEMRQGHATWYSPSVYQNSDMYQAVFVHWDHNGYRLPTSAEWEAAYRAGDEATPMDYPWPGGVAAGTNYGWLAANSGDRTQPVGLLLTNTYGLYDLAGNVCEWTWDWQNYNYYQAHNPKGTETPDFFGKVVRGACFGGVAVRADNRDTNHQRESETRPIIGLRVVRCDTDVHPDTNIFIAPIVLNINTAEYRRLDGATHRGSLWRQGVFPVTTAAAPFSLKWSFTTGSNVFSSPVVWQGVVYVGSDDGKVYALDATTGTQRWAFAANANLPVRSSATIADGFVYMGNQAGSAAGQYGYLYKLDATVGTQCWQYRYGTSRVDVDTSPAVNFGVVFARHGGTFNGVAVSNGQEVWRYRFHTLNKGPLGPAMDGGILYAPGADNLHFAANVRDEQELWYKVGNHCGACIVPVDETRHLYVFGYAASCRNRQTGNTIWSKSFGSGLDVTPYCTPAVGPVQLGANTSNLVFACIQTNLIAMDVNNGNKLWQWTHTAEFRSSPSLVGNMLFLGCDDGYIYALNAATGAIIWQYKTGGMVRSSPWIDAQGVLYVGSDDGRVYALNTGVPEPAVGGMLAVLATSLYAMLGR